MNIAVVGSRNILDKNLIFNHIDELVSNIDSEIKIISGGAKGVDSIASDWAKQNNVEIIEIKPNWKLGRGAGIIRNKDIVKQADIVLAIWDGVSKGTLSSINFAKSLNKKLIVIKT